MRTSRMYLYLSSIPCPRTPLCVVEKLHVGTDTLKKILDIQLYSRLIGTWGLWKKKEYGKEEEEEKKGNLERESEKRETKSLIIAFKGMSLGMTAIAV